MALTLYVDGDRWRTHLKAVHARHRELVPVVKGNGYGFGLHRLARKTQWLGVDTLAVGTYDELPEVSTRYDGSLLVLTPWRPVRPVVDDPRVIHTVGRLEDLDALAEQGRASGRPPRVVLERMTSMLRHGFRAKGLRDAGRSVADGAAVTVEGVALHLPLARPAHGTSHLSEVERLMNDVVAAGVD